MRPFVAATLIAALTLTGCGEDEPPSAAAEDSTQRVADEPEVTCGALSWPVSVMDEGVEGLVNEAEVSAALSGLLEEAPMDAPQSSPWIALAGGTHNGREVVVLGVGSWSSQDGMGEGAQEVTLEWTATGLQPLGWGSCHLSVALPEGRSQVEITAPQGGVGGATTTPTVEVHERECTGGRNPLRFLGEPKIVETGDRVVVTMSSEAVVGNQTCQGNPSVPVTLELSEPIGDRELVDGGVWPHRSIEVRGPMGSAESGA